MHNILALRMRRRRQTNADNFETRAHSFLSEALLRRVASSLLKSLNFSSYICAEEEH